MPAEDHIGERHADIKRWQEAGNHLLPWGRHLINTSMTQNSDTIKTCDRRKKATLVAATTAGCRRVMSLAKLRPDITHDHRSSVTRLNQAIFLHRHVSTKRSIFGFSHGTGHGFYGLRLATGVTPHALWHHRLLVACASLRLFRRLA